MPVMSQDPQSDYGFPSPRHRAHLSLNTSASGVADSTISYNTFATGITEESLNLSQFPPPPVTLPSTPVAERFLPTPSSHSTFRVPSPPRAHPGIDQGQPSPAQSTFTITANAYSGVAGVDQGQPSPSWTTYTVTARSQSHASRPASPPVRPGFVLDRDHPSPTLSTFTITAPLTVSTAPLYPAADVQPIVFPSHRDFSDDGYSSRGHGKPESQQNFDHRAESQSPTPLLTDGKLSPFDWHEGSSILSVDPAEERMLSTSFITSLLSSNTPDKTPSGGSSPQGLHPPPSQANVSNLVSEMSYPPLSLRHNEPVAGSGLSLSTSHSPTVPGEGPNSRINRENDAMASYSHEEHPNTVQTTGIPPSTLRHMASDTSVSESLHPRSQVTYGSTSPLNPYPPPAFSSAMDRMQTTDTQPSVGLPQGWIPERSVSPDFSSGKRPGKSQRRTSAHSSRTVRTHVSSLISSVGQRTARVARATMGWMRVKPLPPIPTIPHTSIHQEREHRRMEGAVPLPQLADRADRLAVMLDSGHLPTNSIIRATSRFSSDKASPTSPQRLQGANSDKSPPKGHSPWKFKLFPKLIINRSGKVKVFIGVSVLALLVLIGIIVGVVVGRRHGHVTSCPANRTGNTCSLDSTCACASSAGQCNPLAQSLVSLIPTVNKQFNANFTPETVADALSTSGVSALSDDCAAQARVVDVSPALDSQSMPNRTGWAQGVLLWTFVLSQNTSSVGQLRDFISKAHWKSLTGDGPVTGFSSEFSTTQLGYTFDFAGQTISEPNVSFVTDGQPSNAQLEQVDYTAHAALDRMYSFASASSTLRKTAMANYWQNVLRQDPNNLLTFVTLIMSSPILLPFDANGTAGNTSISSLLTNSSTAPFPPPLACYPGLSQSQFQLITNFETSVFGLSSPTVQTNFNVSCFPNRPVYGVLDILHLRLPFPDSRTGAKQAAILSRDASPRVVVYNREVFSDLTNSNTSSIPTTDPRQFGTLHHITHVLLDFFKAIPDIAVATQLVDYVLSSPATPPSNNTRLGQSLNTIPTIEVAVFGSVTAADVIGVVSSFTTPSNNLFFGTNQSLAVRDWAIVAAQAAVTWTEFANSSKVVDDGSFTDSTFNTVWNPAYLYFHSSSNASVSVNNITAGFAAVNKFTST